MAEQGETRYPAGAQILVRDEEWLVKNSIRTDHDGSKIEAVGISEFVRDEEAVFFTEIDTVELLEPEKTRLVPDTSSYFRRGRLFLEAVLRKTPLPQSERGLALADRFLLDPLAYQQRPAELALSMRNLRPRLLIADVVGLGKTLEIGLTLAELIRRGRGERILVVTPQSVLEQFQHELWTRFSIPLVRLDSLGIQRIQREIPAGRNPFTHYKRVIISVDTLKNIGQYRHHLERIRWDAVVIDESHNLINPGSQRRALAEILAPRTDALLLASATPHNGDKRSFADLVSLLDPAAIADPNHYDPAEDLGHLFIRRTKISPEVRDEMGSEWADRGPTRSLHCAANEAEERIFAELTRHWIPAPPNSTDFGTADQDVKPVATDPLFAYNLLKTFLSSHTALAETVATRITTLDKKARKAAAEGRRHDPAIDAEQAALARLREITDSMGDGSEPGDSAKLDKLVEQLKEIGVGPRSTVRAVVFSERIPTLKWLARVVPARLGFPATGDGTVKAVSIMHGGLSDDEQQKILEAFGLADHPVRLLFTGDVASEGVNLHRQCHHLIHYDIPWSLIRIEQRNGRIDRYGQRYEPQFRALILTSAQPGAKDDRTVAEKLLSREEEAHKLNGTAEAETGYYRADEEERRLIRELVEGGSIEDFFASAPAASDGDLADLFGQVDTITEQELPPRAETISLFEPDGDAPVVTERATAAFVDTALAELYGEHAEDRVGLFRDKDTEGREYLSLSPAKAPDLLHRLKALPPSYLKEQGIAERMLLTFDRQLAQRKLTEARESSHTMWPGVSFLTDIHPVVEWLTDKVLVQFGRQEAPVITSPHVEQPTFLVQGIYSNALGRPTVVRWMAVSGLPGTPEVRAMDEALSAAKVGPRLARTGGPADLAHLQSLIPAAVAAARDHLEASKDEWEEQISKPLADYRDHLKQWQQDSLLPGTTGRRERQIEETADEQARLLDQLQTTGRPLLRVLAVLDRPAPDAPAIDDTTTDRAEN